VKAASPAPYTLFASLANGMVGYVVTEDALTSGGYESRLASSAKMVAGTGYEIAASAKRQLAKLWGA